ncbi:carbonic anhydrase [Campylobacter geochelonis]|uniref:Carbonic anhydrase n=1 Tax=Campylobacter geochelonis TaxID=1780362 RepID=A0A128EBW0_9BACT|nr:carbonic anhydrase [Campylobacter geochelonis]QKF70367.1 beta carbonic anhydrase, clade B [Campylobacter geochelonis]CZE46202.1 carbonic anhydrase [Campylobacter geochelonis]CZE46429.1 carbonic anhydrase [Campylobacter geochelonis]CZE50749.1 carbonic anhydrase [Campylobacter geochelonis]
MDKIVQGGIKFMEEDFVQNAELFQDLADKQTPHSLFIGCSDSRVVPNLITNTQPGELFVVRNIANIVPKYRIGDEVFATTSAIEYALYVLNIKSIIICGHSNCGGCAALYYDESKLERVPNVKHWLNLLKPIKEEVEKLNLKDFSKKAWYTERLNIANSIKNLMTYPGVEDAVKSGEIKIYGWHYIIETGSLFSYDMKDGHFKLLDKGIDYERIYNEIFIDY